MTASVQIAPKQIFVAICIPLWYNKVNKEER